MSQQLLDVLKAQRRRRRLSFWLGFLTILLVGGIWAQLSKDPIGPNFGDDFADDFVVEQGEFIQDAPAFEVETTLVVEPELDEPPVTTVPLTTVPPTTVEP